MKNQYLKSLAPALLFLLASCSKEPLTTIEPSKVPVTIALKDSAFTFDNPVDKALLLELINDVRSKGCNCGDTFMAPAPAVTWNEKLEKAAWLHSREMSDSSYFSHTGKNGSNAGDRIRKMGYNYKAYRENIAFGILTERTIIKGWMSSVTHCMAMMNPAVKETGIARYQNFWTQELALHH